MKTLLSLILVTGLATTLLFALQAYLSKDSYDRQLLNHCTLNGYYELYDVVVRCELVQWRDLND